MIQHYVALPLHEDFRQQIVALNQKFMAGSRQSLSREAGQLMSEVSCQIIDRVFKQMIEQFLQVEGLSEQKRAHLNTSLKHIDDIKAIMRKYMGWAVSWFGNERLTPVVNLFTQMIQQEKWHDQQQAYLVFNLPQTTAERALLALCSLEHGKVNNAEGAVESLIEVTDIGMDALIRQPKALLKFNMVADKTLNGVISITTTRAYGNLRQLGQQLDPLLFKTVAKHLQQFIGARKT